MSSLTPKSVAQAVRERIQEEHPGGATLEVIEQNVHWQDGFWHVPVKISEEPRRKYQFYEVLADAEENLDENEHLKVLLVPVYPDEITLPIGPNT